MKCPHCDGSGELSTTGAIIKSMRLRRHLTLAAMSERCGLPLATISRVETGFSTPSLKTLGKIAGAFQVRIGDLLCH